MATETQQSRAVGGIPSSDGPGAIVDTGRDIEDTDGATLPTYQAGGWLPSDVASVVRLLERLYAHLLSPNAQLVRRGYTDQIAPLQAGIDQEMILDARPFGYTQVAISATSAANIELFREGVVFSFALTPGKWATIQQPAGTKIRLKAGDLPITATIRYSDQVFGVVQP